MSFFLHSPPDMKFVKKLHDQIFEPKILQLKNAPTALLTIKQHKSIKLVNTGCHKKVLIEQNHNQN